MCESNFGNVGGVLVIEEWSSNIPISCPGLRQPNKSSQQTKSLPKIGQVVEEIDFQHKY